MNTEQEIYLRNITALFLMELGLPPHRMGFQQICVAVPLFLRDRHQSLTKEIYPSVAETTGSSDWRSVERTMRDIIMCGWRRRYSNVWSQYFPYCRKTPTNKQFIATLAEIIRSRYPDVTKDIQ